MSEYKIKFYQDSITKKEPVFEYLKTLDKKNKAKILKYLEFLREHNGCLDEPYSKHIKGKIRELRIDFSRNRHRIFYFTFLDKNIILLSSFLKKTRKIPIKEINKAINNLKEVLSNPKLYD
jgi:phage-related protein